MQKNFIITLLLLLFSNPLFSQIVKCGSENAISKMLLNKQITNEDLLKSEQQIENYKKSKDNSSCRIMPSDPILIPVVFHVLYNNSTQNISDAQITEQLNQLKADFSATNSDYGNVPTAFNATKGNPNIVFTMAKRKPDGTSTNGIIHKYTSSSSFSPNANNMKHSSTGGDDAWDVTQYLNIWICNIYQGTNDTAGFGSFPTSTLNNEDGIVVDYKFIGSINSPGLFTPQEYAEGRVPTHEAGHWLNLYHIWGNSNNGCIDSDNVSDTPNQDQESTGCPSFPKTDACTTLSPGIMFMNFMDYSTCLKFFTKGQVDRMRALFEPNGMRQCMLSSIGYWDVATSIERCATSSSRVDKTLNLVPSSNSITLNWSDDSEVNSYKIRYRAFNTSTWTTTGNIFPTSGNLNLTYLITSLNSNTLYEIQFQQDCGCLIGNWSSSVYRSTTGCSNSYESNNTSANASTIPMSASGFNNWYTSIYSQIATSGDVDWYKVTTVMPKLKVSLSTLPADYDILLYNSTGTTILGSSINSGTNDEIIIFNTPTSNATYLIKVFPKVSTVNSTSCYTLTVYNAFGSFKLINPENNSEESNENNIISDFDINPNPAKNSINIINKNQLQINDVILYDISGRIVTNAKFTPTKSSSDLSYNIDDVPNGIYIVSIIYNNKIENKKIIISK